MSNADLLGDWLGSGSGLLDARGGARNQYASAAGKVWRRYGEDAANSICGAAVSFVMDEGSRRVFDRRGARAGFFTPVSGSQLVHAIVVVPRPKASRSRLRQLYLTAFSPGGSRAQLLIRRIQRPCDVFRRVHPGSASERCVADGSQCAR